MQIRSGYERSMRSLRLSMNLSASVLVLSLSGLGVLVSAPAPAQTAEWTLRAVGGPAARNAPAMAYDAARAQTVLFGGYTAGGFNSETWVWSGSEWTQKLVGGPSGRSAHAMAYDQARGVTVLFGGYNTQTYHNGETWAWDGNSWTQFAVSGPSPRYGHAMVYDSARAVTVLFGGYAQDVIGPKIASSGPWNGETWEWDGTSWTRRDVIGPSPRAWHAMAYDAARGVSVLFGGSYNVGGYVISDETWEWDGSVWTQRMISGPCGREFPTMAYDAGGGVSVLFGGNTAAGLSGETWQWNGNVWAQGVTGGPSPRDYAPMIYDTARQVIVLYGGCLSPTDGSINSDETWELAADLGPTANAGPDLPAITGDPIAVSGAASTNPNGAPLDFAWTIIGRPAGSAAALLGETSEVCVFFPDLPGSYTLQLVVTDPSGLSASDTVVISAITGEQFVENVAAESLLIIADLPPTSIATAGNQRALSSFLSQIIRAAQDRNLGVARATLERCIERTDGCTLRGQPDANGPGKDWILDCQTQRELYSALAGALDAISP